MFSSTYQDVDINYLSVTNITNEKIKCLQDSGTYKGCSKMAIGPYSFKDNS